MTRNVSYILHTNLLAYDFSQLQFFFNYDTQAIT